MGFVIEFMMIGMISVGSYLAIENIKNADNIHDVIVEIISLVFFVACLIGFVILAIMLS